MNAQQQRLAKVMYKITCADCGKEASLPFKPAEGRPVYCKECFALRKRGNGPIRAEDHNPNMAPSFIQAPKQAPKAGPKKKPAAAKKTAVKKKAAPKKK
ncbi:MAG: hypothetical protein KGJ09_06725 [Candidatus Omnitrophica bacterium]|nr:hypothetical protein [Candidatus Omnitrophota bacterium]MDE2009758.1 hypothetical protein [Candidatus Omnitrophota bacterium]MDE2213847.1 hypothetical protein [Candidatus Omnitrophota bacterium]MDE2232380.1 hypothetical protein [Candidatus Omnitrophota bacterium]